MRKRYIAILTPGIAALSVLAFLAWLRMPREFRDDTPLPQGPINEPVVDARDSTSRLRVGIRVKLKALERAINKLPGFPQTFPIKVPEGSGTLTRSNVEISRAEVDRLGLSGTVKFEGELEGPAWTKVRMVRAAYTGSSVALRVKENWDLDLSPDIKAEVMDVNLGVISIPVPDGISKWALNKYVVPSLTKQAGQFPIPPLNPIVEQAWKDANFEFPIRQDPLILVGHRPIRAYLGGPVIDESTQSLVLNLGLELRSWCTMKAVGEPSHPVVIAPLLPLARQPLDQSTTVLRVPLMVNLDVLAKMFKPQTASFGSGNMQIRSLELSDKDGEIHARLNVDFDTPSGILGLLPRASKGTLVVKAKPSCDPKTGELRLNGLRFTPASNSILMNHLGENASGVLEANMEKLVPVFSGWLKNRVESEVNAKAEEFLAPQIKQWVKANPDFRDLLRTTRSQVGNIQIKPIKLESQTGYLFLVLSAKADLGISID